MFTSVFRSLNILLSLNVFLPPPRQSLLPLRGISRTEPGLKYTLLAESPSAPPQRGSGPSLLQLTQPRVSVWLLVMALSKLSMVGKH